MSIFLDALSEFSYASTEKGRNYYLEGRVLSLKVTDNVCQAIVKGQGTSLYKTTIRFSRKFEMMNHSCSCPVGHYCKHIVAVLYKLDRMVDNGEITFSTTENKASWQDEVDNIFLRYFSNRYHFNPNYGPLNAYIKNNLTFISHEIEDVIFYIMSKVLDYYYNYHYDLGYIVRFFDLIINDYLTREQYTKVLEKFKADTSHFLTNLNIFLKIDNISMTTNLFISKLLDGDDFSKFIDKEDNLFLVNELTIDNTIKIARSYPKLLNQRSIEDRISYFKGNDLKNAKNVEFVYSLLLAYVKKGQYLHYDYYPLVDTLKKVDVKLYRSLLLEMFMKKHEAHVFVSLVLSYPDYIVDEETLAKLNNMKNKPYFLNIYLHKPVNLEEVPLNEIVELFSIENFFSGYESYLTDLALRKINHAKKLKNFDLDIINGLTMLDYLKYGDLVSLLFDKNIKEKFISTYNRFYYYLLFKHDLLGAIGYKKYGIIG